MRAGSLANMFAGAREARRKKAIAALPETLPVYIFSGEADPVHAEQKGPRALTESLSAADRFGHYKLYPDGRHEMLNETNRQEVVDDLTGWLATTLARQSSAIRIGRRLPVRVGRLVPVLVHPLVHVFNAS